MKHYTITIDSEGFSTGAEMWEDNARPEVPEVAAIPAVLNDAGEVMTPAVDTVPAIPAYDGDPLPPDRVLTTVPQDGSIKYRAKWTGTEWVEGGTAPTLTPADIVKAMEQLFDQTAQSHHYDNRITCALRAGYPGPFQAEGIAFATWMDSQNAKAYVMLSQVQAGTMSMPATVADALALLDPMVWPV